MINSNIKNILNLCKYVVDNSKFVIINYDNVEEYAKNLTNNKIEDFNPGQLLSTIVKLDQLQLLHLVLIFNAISFSYWPDEGQLKWSIEYKDQKCDGAYGMMCALVKAIENGIDINNTKYLSQITKDELADILKGNTIIPLFNERLSILHEVGIGLSKFNNSFENMIKIANHDIFILLGLIIDNFPNFRDESIYKGKKIYFYKRAQLLISDIAKVFKKSNIGKFNNLDQLTAGADYKIPMVLRSLALIDYTKELAEKVDNKIQLKYGSEEEIEIRANTIWVIELIKNLIRDKMKSDYSSNDLHYHFWVISQTPNKADKPYHLTRSIYY